ncbi:uncharacterized protein LOC106643863 [Copidosoma floridanum]|uniref:uncharacterized protein LOC106643863 n=1 Tax=Copidosoma floridanum TaxID=29053 RepID=UPI0006C9C012|nr:uncharacterized protein LOC106643863 [Copidosoma floridanum]
MTRPVLISIISTFTTHTAYADSHLTESLKLPVKDCSVSIGAVDDLCTISKKCIKLTFQSNHTKFGKELEFLIVPKITNLVPDEIFPRELYHIPKNIQLADPKFHIPQAVDILLSSGTTLAVLAVGQLNITHNTTNIILQKTSLGWIAAGGSDNISTSRKASCNVVKLDTMIERFWLVEEIDTEPSKSRDEIACEKHFVNNTRRDPTGRYIVRLPFRCNKFELGESCSQALNRFYSLERKFKVNPNFKVEYEKVMQEYIDLNHMSLANDTVGGYYLPHHAIIKSSSETTKLRVVFDASAKTSTGISLNEVLLVGPTIQDKIFEQVIKFRAHKYVITADIARMYRQIIVHPDDRKYQRVLWYHNHQIRTYELNTVTFGVSSAPFLAIRTIQQLANDEASNSPRASKILLRDLYVDDLITGADTLGEIIQIRDEVIELLSRGGFTIRQWASNHEAALNNIDKKFFDLDCLIKENPVQKTLGIIWNSQHDKLQYKVQVIDPKDTCTKRKLISEISKIFDPLGLVGPVSLYARVLIQDCWKSKITWDESLPQEIHTRWATVAEQLHLLEKLSIDRHILIHNFARIEIHGFCDASIRGYGACIYFRSIDVKGKVLVRLACAKSRVAPLKNMTTPRLELSAASLLKKLYVTMRSQFELHVDRVVLWSDSTIALHWISKAPHLLRTFESNRVADIQTLGAEVQWRHVRTDDNPADALSRGQLPADFLLNNTWFSGPSWLSQAENTWPPSVEISSREDSGFKQRFCLLTTNSVSEIYSRFSSYQILIKTIALIFRWRTKLNKGLPITVEEAREAELKLLRSIQHEKFPVEVKRLSTAHDTESGQISVPYRKTTRFDNLHPFIDNDGLLRVGGRLKNSQLTYNQKHPVLLPSKHHVTDLIIRQYHQSNLHGGIQSTLYSIRERFWIINGRDQVRKIIRHCVDCIRTKPKPLQAQMADLPAARVIKAPAFSHVGVDFFGPLYIKEKQFRSRTTLKVYGCVFVCIMSKAVHIELAHDLSMEGFLAIFRRFISRRGIPKHVYSDNETNFVGANNELREIYDLFKTPEYENQIENYALSNRITWHFNPPLSPHFGGLWEAAVKSFKHHLKRTLKNHTLTYEQMQTLLIEIEAILNSRPICTLSADPNDPLALTPAHILIGKSFKTLPEKNLVSVPDNRLSTWNFITKA